MFILTRKPWKVFVFMAGGYLGKIMLGNPSVPKIITRECEIKSNVQKDVAIGRYSGLVKYNYTLRLLVSKKWPEKTLLLNYLVIPGLFSTLLLNPSWEKSL